MERAGLFHRFLQPHERLFLARESVALRGRRDRVFRLLLAMVLAAFLAVVLAHSGKQHLRRSMDDPFTSQIGIDVSGKHSMNYGTIRNFLDSCAQHGAYDAIHSSGSYLDGWHFHARGRLEYIPTVSFGFWKDEALFKRIMQPDNVVDPLAGKAMSGDPQVFKDGIIISKEFFDLLGCEASELLSKRILLNYGGHTVPLHVLAVVRSLPRRYWCLVEHRLMLDIQNGKDATYPLRDFDSMGVWLLGGVAELEEGVLQEWLSQYIGEPVSVKLEEEVDLLTHTRRLVISRNSGKAWDTSDMENWQQRFTTFSSLKEYRPAVEFDVRLRAPDSISVITERFDHLTITFSSVDQVDEFRRAIREKTAPTDQEIASAQSRFKGAVELDLARVEAQKNFGVVAGLGGFLLVALVLFAMLSILLYLYNLLRNHLERVKMNLGTFMAFGLSPDLIRAGYLRIILLLLLRVIGVAVAVLLGLQAVLWGIGRLGVRVPPVLADMSVLTDPWLYLCAVGILASSVLICRWQLSLFLTAPPGDLIYDRT